MTQRQKTPEWYFEGDVARSVRKAREMGVSKSSTISWLEDAAFDDIPKGRIETIVESVPDSGSDGDGKELPLSQDPSIDETPREQAARRASVLDIQYLSPREAARVIGLALEQFDGNTVRPAPNESTECDLYWHRQRMTVGLRVVPVLAKTVGAEHVMALSDGKTTVDDSRAPSELAVVTNGKYTDKAKTVAIEQDIHYFDAGHLEAWLRRAKITPEALGTVLEEGENHDGPLDELIDLSEVPSSVVVDPFEMERAFEEAAIPDDAETTKERRTIKRDSSKPNESTTTSGTDNVIKDRPKSRGETGTLYADPSEDGDYDAFDRFVDDLKHGETSIETPEEGESEPEAEAGNAESEEATTNPEDVSRNELLFDLIEVKRAAGEPLTQQNIREQGSYSVSQFEAKFDSLADALDVANIKYDGDSL